MFQNDERMKLGRFTQPTVSDISIEWLMQAYYSTLQRENKNIHLVPCAINYDRLFEIRNLANETVSNETPELNAATVGRMIREQTGQTRGKIYVTFGKPINFERFLTSQKLMPLKPNLMDEAALSLTTHLVLQQEYASPVVLNMIVAALLLQESSAKVKFNHFFDSVTHIYNWLIIRGGVKMIMREPPSKRAVLDIIGKLGFRMKTTEKREGQRRGI